MMKTKFLLVMTLCLAFIGSAFAEGEILKRGRALQRQQKYAEAISLYEKALQQNPTADLYIEHGSLLGKMQKYDEARQLLEKGLKEYGDNRSLKNLLALILLRTGDKARARSLLEEVLAADPNNGFAKKWLAKVAQAPAAQPTDDSDATGFSSQESNTGDGIKADASLDEEQQKELAIKLYKEMMTLEKWELDSFKALHREVIEKCPETGQAEESCWRLSNLYLLAEEPPAYHAIIEVLEHLAKTYPDSPLMPDVKNRLLISYQKTGQSAKVVSLYQELFTVDPDPKNDKIFMVRALEFADALAATGRSADAQLWYRKILEKDEGRDMLEARVARQRLQGND